MDLFLTYRGIVRVKGVFWTGAAASAVVVEADAFKESDVIYQAINSRGHHNDMLQTAELGVSCCNNIMLAWH
jgi:hypothetical protein